MYHASDTQRQYRVVDQSLTMHALLRDRYFRRALVLNTAQIGISLFLCAFAFVPDNLLASINLAPTTARFAVGIAGVCLLLVAITEFRVDWRATGSLHAAAVRELSEIKGQLRRSYHERSDNDIDTKQLTTKYEKTMGIVPPIPERYFLKLKSRHEFKRVLSEEVSHSPTAPVWLLRLRLRWSGSLRAFKKIEVRPCEEKSK